MKTQHTPGPWQALTMKTQHTPGPWQADKWAPGITVSAPESHYSVCHLEDCNNAEANARLIAAAPELLVALKDCVASMERLEDKQGAYRVTCIQQARAAIAKALTMKTQHTPDLADKIARAIFKMGDDLGTTPCQRIAFKGGTYPRDETDQGGLCEVALSRCIRAAIAKATGEKP